MLKLAGMGLLLAAGAGLGFAAGGKLTRRERALKELHQLVLILEGEIRYGITALPDAFGAAARRMPEPWRSFLMELDMRLNSASGASLDEVFRECAGKNPGRLPFSKEERELLFSLGGRLGYLDKEMQLKQLALYEEELKGLQESFGKGLPEQKRLRQVLGILGGIFLVILLW